MFGILGFTRQHVVTPSVNTVQPLVRRARRLRQCVSPRLLEKLAESRTKPDPCQVALWTSLVPRNWLQNVLKMKVKTVSLQCTKIPSFRNCTAFSYNIVLSISLKTLIITKDTFARSEYEEFVCKTRLIQN